MSEEAEFVRLLRMVSPEEEQDVLQAFRNIAATESVELTETVADRPSFLPQNLVWATPTVIDLFRPLRVA